MFGFPAVAACMPAHDEALNERSLMPPVSVTMQPRNLPVAAAELLEPAAALDELLVPPPDAEVWLLPHAAMTTVADTASAAVAHALCLTLTSTGPARGTRLASHSSWVVPQVMPGDPRWEGDTRLSGALVAESEPGEDGSPGLSDRDPGSAPGVLVLSYMLRAAGEELSWALGAVGTPGNSRTAVSPPPGVSSSRA